VIGDHIPFASILFWDFRCVNFIEKDLAFFDNSGAVWLGQPVLQVTGSEK